jgi:hypothetical protein
MATELQLSALAAAADGLTRIGSDKSASPSSADGSAAGPADDVAAVGDARHDAEAAEDDGDDPWSPEPRQRTL